MEHKIRLGCDIDGHVWNPRAGDVFYKNSNCPKCYKTNRGLKVEDVDDRLKNLNIKRISNFKDTKSKMLFLCSNNTKLILV